MRRRHDGRLILRQRPLLAMRQHNWPVTFSIGIASDRHTPQNFDGLLAAADALMYEAKNSGRDRILQRTFADDES